MEWEKYYEKFYEWAPSTQHNRLSSLSNFTSNAEIIEIVENFDEKGAAKLIKKALSQNVRFNPKEIINIGEYVDKETTILLLKQCDDQFTPDQVIQLQDCTMMYEDEIVNLLKHRVDGYTWAAFYRDFFFMNEFDQFVSVNQINEFGDQEEVFEVAMCLPKGKRQYRFIQRAMDHHVIFSRENKELLADVDVSIAKLLGINVEIKPKEPKLSLTTKIGLGWMFANLLDKLVNKNKN